MSPTSKTFLKNSFFIFILTVIFTTIFIFSRDAVQVFLHSLSAWAIFVLSYLAVLIFFKPKFYNIVSSALLALASYNLYSLMIIDKPLESVLTTVTAVSFCLSFYFSAFNLVVLYFKLNKAKKAKHID